MIRLMWALSLVFTVSSFAQEPTRDAVLDVLRREAVRKMSGVTDVDDYLKLMSLIRSFDPDAALEFTENAGVSQPLRDLFRAWALHQKGDYRDALSLFNGLDENHKDYDEYLSNRLVELRKTDQALLEFSVLETSNFSIRYQAGRDEAMIEFLPAVMESAYSRLSKIFQFERDEKIIVELMPDYELFSYASALTKKQIETTGTVALCVENRVVVLTPRRVAMGYYWPNVISHEFIHYIMTKIGGDSVPLWFHEGVAKFFEGRWDAEIQPPLEDSLQTRLAQALAANSLVTFEQMYPSFAALPTPQLAQLAYAQTASMIEFICDKKGTDFIPDLLREVDEKNTVETILGTAFERDIDGFLELWKSWAHIRDYKKSAELSDEDSAVTLLDSDFGAEKLDALSEEDESIKKHTRLGDLLLDNHRYGPALKEYAKATADQKEPYSRQMMMRFLVCYEHLSRGQEMITLIDEQITNWKMDPTMLKYKAMAFMRLDNTDEAKSMLIQAVRVNPFDPKVHELRRRVAESEGDSETLEQVQKLLDILSQPIVKDPSKS